MWYPQLVVPSPTTCMPPAPHTHHTGGPTPHYIPPAPHTHHTGGPIPYYMYTTSSPYSPHWWSHPPLHITTSNPHSPHWWSHPLLHVYHQQPTLTTLVVPSPTTCIPPATHTHHTGGPIPYYMCTTSNPHSHNDELSSI